MSEKDEGEGVREALKEDGNDGEVREYTGKG